MKNSKRIVIFLIAILNVATIAGCQNSSSNSVWSDTSSEETDSTISTATSEDEQSVTSGSNQLSEVISTSSSSTIPTVASIKPTALSCWAFAQPDFKIDDFENNEFTKWLEEKTNTTLSFTTGPANDAKTKLTILLSSGQYPDILFSPGFTPSEQEFYGQMGMIIPLNNLIDKLGTETKKVFAQVPAMKTAVTRSSGKIYCLPSYQEDPHSKSFSRMWVYKPWLDKLKIKVPTTTEEYYQMLIKFRDMDPNGNNKKDEIPYTGAQVMFSDPFGYFMNSFIYFDNNKLLNIKNGMVTPVYTTDEYKAGLEYLNKLYTNNLLLPQTFSQNDQSLRQLLNNDTPIVGSFTTHAPFLYCNETVYQNYIAISPLKGPGGVQYACQYYNTETDGSVITNHCKNQEAAFRLLDFLYSDEASMRKSCGPLGVSWKYNTDKALTNAYGNTPTWITLTKTNKPNSMWALIGNGFQPLTRSGVYVMDMSPEAVAARKNNSTFVEPYVQIEKAAIECYNDYFPSQEIRLPQALVFTEEEAFDLSDTELGVTNHVNELRVKFVTGSSSLSTDWQTYLSNLNKLGLKDVLQLYQDAYDRQK